MGTHASFNVIRKNDENAVCKNLTQMKTTMKDTLSFQWVKAIIEFYYNFSYKTNYRSAFDGVESSKRSVDRYQ